MALLELSAVTLLWAARKVLAYFRVLGEGLLRPVHSLRINKALRNKKYIIIQGSMQK